MSSSNLTSSYPSLDHTNISHGLPHLLTDSLHMQENFTNPINCPPTAAMLEYKGLCKISLASAKSFIV